MTGAMLVFWAQNKDNVGPDHWSAWSADGHETPVSEELQERIISVLSMIRGSGQRVYVDPNDEFSYVYFRRRKGSGWECLISVNLKDEDVAHRSSPISCYVVKDGEKRSAPGNKYDNMNISGIGRRFVGGLRSFASVIGRPVEDAQCAAMDAVLQTLDSITESKLRSGLFSWSSVILAAFFLS